MFAISDQAFSGVGAAVEDDILDEIAKFRFDFLVHLEHSGIDDTHVHAGLNGMEEESAVHGFPHRIITSETERNIGDTTTHFGVR